MSRDDLHRFACDTLRLALAFGGTTPDYLRRATEDGDYPERDLQTTIMLGRVMTMAKFLAPRWLVDEGGDLVRYSGFGREGVYFVEAYWPPYDAEFRVQASFVPYGATAPAEIVTLLDFDIRDSRPGRDLLAALYRGPSPAQKARGWQPLKPAINDLFWAMVRRGTDAIREHATGQYAGPASPLPAIPPEIAAMVADRWYPREALMQTQRGHDEKWVAEVPGKGHFVVFENPNPFMKFVTLDGRYEEEWPEHADDLMFRPTDEDIDPGLADRIRRASHIRGAALLPAKLGA